MLRITDNIYGIMTRFSYVNFYVLVNGDRLTVVDTGINADDMRHLERELAAHEYSIEQIRYILITHAHNDHIGGLAALQERVNAHTMAHRLDAPVIRGQQAPSYERIENLGFFSRLVLQMIASGPRSQPARVDTDLHGGEILDDVLPGLEVLPLPGHSYGQIGFFLPAEKVLIGGDVMIHLPWGLARPPRPVSPDWTAVSESIRKVVDLTPRILCLGHGRVVEGNIAQRAAHLL